MPDVLTHILFAERVKDGISDINVKDAIENNISLYYFGSQGPDFLFYQITPLVFDKRVSSAGAMMHKIETAKFFKDFILWLEKLNGEEYEQYLAYFAGFLTHFYCDKTIHPYVEATREQGAGSFGNPNSRIKLSHYIIEYMMDIRLWKKIKNIDAYRQDINSIIGNEPLPYEIVRFITEFINDTQPNAVSKNEVYSASIKMRTAHKALYDPKNRKKWFINLLPLPRKCYVEEKLPEIDVLNLNHRQWSHVMNKDEINDASVYDLLDVARKECVKCLDEISEMLERGIKKDLDKLIPDVGYLTNKGT
ncbi:MAG: zinc dependent phospholipase C family protein [Clostridia bacterium]